VKKKSILGCHFLIQYSRVSCNGRAIEWNGYEWCGVGDEWHMIQSGNCNLAFLIKLGFFACKEAGTPCSEQFVTWSFVYHGGRTGPWIGVLSSPARFQCLPHGFWPSSSGGVLRSRNPRSRNGGGRRPWSSSVKSSHGRSESGRRGGYCPIHPMIVSIAWNYNQSNIQLLIFQGSRSRLVELFDAEVGWSQTTYHAMPNQL